MKKLILPPKITKFKKQHKGVLTPIDWRKKSSNVTIGVYGIQILKSLRMNLKQLETTRKLIALHLSKTETFWFKIIPDIPVSRKPNEIRMGKGKGDLGFWAFRVKAGQTFLEFSFVSPQKAKVIYLALAKKLPVPCILIRNTRKI